MYWHNPATAFFSPVLVKWGEPHLSTKWQQAPLQAFLPVTMSSSCMTARSINRARSSGHSSQNKHRPLRKSSPFSHAARSTRQTHTPAFLFVPVATSAIGLGPTAHLYSFVVDTLSITTPGALLSALNPESYVPHPAVGLRMKRDCNWVIQGTPSRRWWPLYNSRLFNQLIESN